MRRRNFIKSIAVLPVIGFIPNLFANKTTVYPKTVIELKQWMENALPVGEGTDHQYSVTGEEYIEYHRVWEDPNEVMLCRLQWNTFTKQYRELKGSGHKLYWRIKPEYTEYDYAELERFDTLTPNRFPDDHIDLRSRLYTRYLISNKSESANGS